MQTLTKKIPQQSAPLIRNRVSSIDFLRGLVMVIMALDHVRDFFHNQAVTGSPTDMATTTPFLFFTRWITHFCAPTFVFLSGASAFLAGRRKSKKQLSLFLIKRGVWLVFVEFFIISLALSFDPLYHLFFLQVIWAIGVSMIILGLLVWLPLEIILLLGLIIVFGHNILDKPEALRQGHVGVFWDILHRSNFSPYTITPGHTLIFVYAIGPWAGVMMLGYCFGRLFTADVSASSRQKALWIIGGSAVLFFVIMRYLNVYGEPSPWQVQRNSTITILSFLNTTKYPPSLMYLTMTLGPSIIFLALAEKARNRISHIFITYGRVPFFYYVIHFFIIHIICVAAFFLSGYGTSDIVSQQSPFLFRPAQFGFNLGIVYVIWLLVVIALYPLCRWYNRYKATHDNWWLSYL